MDASNPRDRIWDKMVDTERMSRYYARRAQSLEFRHLALSLVNTILFISALATYQIDANTVLKLSSDLPDHLVPFILIFLSAVLQAYLLQFSPYKYSKAAGVMSLQSGKLVEHWRKLWIDFSNNKKENLHLRIETLEDLTKHVSTTQIPYHEKTNDECDKEAKVEFAKQFGKIQANGG